MVSVDPGILPAERMPVDITSLVDPACTAVLVSECQEAVLGASSPLAGLRNAARDGNTINNISVLLDTARQHRVRIVHCHLQRREDGLGNPENTPLAGYMSTLRGRAQGFAENSDGVKPLTALSPRDDDIVVSRLHGITAFHDTGLDALLRDAGIRNIIFTGVSLNVAVFGGTVEAINRGYRVVIPANCVAADPPLYGDLLLKNSLRQLAYISDSESIMRCWSRE